MWRLFAAVAAICMALLLWPEALTALRWQRGAVSDGQLLRVLSAHFVHLSLWHACANLAGLALVIELLGASVRPVEAVLLMLVSGWVIVAGLAVLSPAVGWYAGLSGVVHGLWAGLAILGWRRQAKFWLPPAALAALVLKLLLWPATLRGLPVVPQSHWYGAIGGATAALLMLARSSWRESCRAKWPGFGLE